MVDLSARVQQVIFLQQESEVSEEDAETDGIASFIPMLEQIQGKKYPMSAISKRIRLTTFITTSRLKITPTFDVLQGRLEPLSY